MPLPPPADREHLHNRDILCRGYRRRDGMYDIEGHLTDTKTYGFDNSERGRVEAGEPVHDMWLRLTVDTDFVIREVEATTEASPFRICPEVTPNFKRLVGLKIGPGWRRKAMQQVGGAQGCTHLVEMLPVLATVVFQTIQGDRNKRRDALRSDNKPFLLDTCHAFRSDGPKVREFWPEFYTGPDKINAERSS